MNKQLVSYIETNILPGYSDFDKAHNLEHVKNVIEESLSLAEDLDVNVDMVYVIAAYHDLGLIDNRETHHILSAKILENDDNLKKWFNPKETLVMKEAVEDHRASSKSSPRTLYGRIVAEADRVIDPVNTLKRTLQFAIKHYPNMCEEFYYKQFLAHLQNKYAEGGYMKLWFENSKNAHKLKELRAIITDKKLLREMFNQLYIQEQII